MGSLDGKELEGKIGDVGSYSVDVDATGKVIISAVVSYEFTGGKVSSTNAVEVGILDLLAQVAAKTSTTLDDEAVAMAKKLLGLVG